MRGDLGVSNDYPLGWDEVDHYYLAQSVSLWAGGEQSLTYESTNFELDASL